MPTTSVILSTIVAAAALFQGTDAHGYVSQPKAEFVPNTIYTTFNAEFTAKQTGIAAFQGKIFNWSPEQNVGVFTSAFKQSGLKDLRTLMDKYVPGCGNTITRTWVRDTTKLKSLKFQNDEYKEGFIASHRGPCEVWIDNTRVFQNNDCAANFKSYPAVLPVDYSKCTRSVCYLRFYWLALHSEKWQAYKQCVPIKYGASRSMDDDESYNFSALTNSRALQANGTESA